MTCTSINQLSDSCNCFRESQPCNSDSYCFKGRCTTENKCGNGFCTTTCACISDTAKVAYTCDGADQYCKNGKVMTLCTADSLATDKCACSFGDEGFCEAMCVEGQCWQRETCRYDDNEATACVCAPTTKKVGVLKKTASSICKMDGTLSYIEGGCADEMDKSQACKCAKDGESCPIDSLCQLGQCNSFPMCGSENCKDDCLCTAGDKKNAVLCSGKDNKCDATSGKIVPVIPNLQCTGAYDIGVYCTCGATSTTMCSSSQVCNGVDCMDFYNRTGCTADVETQYSCICGQQSKVPVFAMPGDVCNADGTVTKLCVNNVPIQIDSCFCKDKSGLICKKGDVCLNEKCYGKDPEAQGKYCEQSAYCTSKCACPNFDFTEAQYCYDPTTRCVSGQVVVLCQQTESLSVECKCSESVSGNCRAESVCYGVQCMPVYNLGERCATNDFCETSCVCYEEGSKTAGVCDTRNKYCQDARVRVVCTTGTINEEGCECVKGDTANCAERNVCLASKCYGSGQGTAGRFCTDGQTCDTACACRAADNKSAVLCDGKAKQCTGGAVVDLCTDKAVNAGSCKCKPSDSVQCAASNVCISDKCYGAGEDDGFCSGTGPCTAACACKSSDSKTAALCFSAYQKCESGAVVTETCPENALKSDNCKCPGAADSCEADALCTGNACYKLSDDNRVCQSSSLCFTACACVSGDKKLGALCSGPKQYCESGVLKKICNDKSVNTESCVCKKGDAAECASQNVCISNKCYGSGSDLEGVLCANRQTCGTKCACMAADGKTAAVCDGTTKLCVSGEVKNMCADGSVNASACYCKSADATECAASNVCISEQCFGTAAPAGDFCSASAACGTGCACKAKDGKTAAKCSGEHNYCVDGAVAVKCPEGFEKDGDTCKKAGDNGNNVGMIVGIVVAVVVVLALVIFLLLFFLKRRKQEQEKIDQQGEKEEEKREENQIQVAAE